MSDEARIAALTAECERLRDRLCWYRATEPEINEAKKTITQAAAVLARSGMGKLSQELMKAGDRMSEALRVARDDKDGL